tara:strand:+ start:2640 stop:3323 length:684 start_codon:yes stop_codon:yes gene_type:complete
MKNNKQKGFAMVLSLVLLLAMSLMGGALIVIASSDHQSNNSSDEYQQTFYVAETALLQAQKSLINKMLGPIRVDTGGRDYDGRIYPTNQLSTEPNLLDQDTPCYKSFRNLSRDSNFRAVEHVREQSFLDLLFPIFNDGNAGLAINSSIDNSTALSQEEENIGKYYYEFFSVSSGTSEYKGTGVSLKKGSGTSQRKGTAYKIYGCGMMGNPNNPEIIVPLETLIVLSH